MGRATPTLQIWVWYPWVTHPAVVALHDAGHHLSGIGSEGGLTSIGRSGEPMTKPPDLILHPAAHGWHDALFEATEKKDGTTRYPYVDTALTAARRRRKGNK